MISIFKKIKIKLEKINETANPRVNQESELQRARVRVWVSHSFPTMMLSNSSESDYYSIDFNQQQWRVALAPRPEKQSQSTQSELAQIDWQLGRHTS